MKSSGGIAQTSAENCSQSCFKRTCKNKKKHGEIAPVAVQRACLGCRGHTRDRWAEAPVKIARMTLTIKLDGNWSSFQLANNTPPLSVTGSVIAPSARMQELIFDARLGASAR